jgi:hypothetical protein
MIACQAELLSLKSLSFSIRTFFVRQILAILIPIGLSLVSSFTLPDNLFLHFLGAFLFFYGSVGYYSLSCPAVDLSCFSTGPGWFCFANIGAIAQHITGLWIFVKIFLFRFDIPQHDFSVSWSPRNESDH